jgi:cell division protein FtsB
MSKKAEKRKKKQQFRYQIVTRFWVVLLPVFALFFRHLNNSVSISFAPNF